MASCKVIKGKRDKLEARILFPSEHKTSFRSIKRLEKQLKKLDKKIKKKEKSINLIINYSFIRIERFECSYY